MSIIEELKKAKDGNEKSYETIIKYYEKYIFYNMNKYNVDDKEDCLENVKQRIRKAIYMFKIDRN